MKSLSVIPHMGIGPLKLGMSPEQIIAAINQIRSEWTLPDNREIQIAEDKEDDGYSLRYVHGSFFFMVRYRNNQAVEISVDNELRNHAIIILYDLDVFKTPAEQLVLFLKQFGTCSYDSEDEQLSCDYEFDSIDIRLWREQPFHLKLLSDETYMKDMELIIDEMYQYLYFQIITVKSL